MRRLRIITRGGATIDADIGGEWNLETDLMKFPPPDDAWRDRLRYLRVEEVIAIVEVREPLDLSEA